MPSQKRFHIYFDSDRTTITVDEILFELLALKLKMLPDDEQAHSEVRNWLQEKIELEIGTMDIRKDASQWARLFLIEEIANSRLMKEHDTWSNK